MCIVRNEITDQRNTAWKATIQCDTSVAIKIVTPKDIGLTLDVEKKSRLFGKLPG